MNIIESYNLWLGENEDSIFTYDMFHQLQTLESGFVPTSNYEQFPERNKKKQVKVLGMDIAVASGRDNDNSVYGLGYYDEKTGKKKIEYIRAYNGLNSIRQVVLAKRLFYDYGCEYFVVDTKGVGNVVFDMLTVPTYDEERGVEYPAWTVCGDSMLQISSDKVLSDKIMRTITQDAKPVIIPIAGTADINSNVHLSMRKSLNDHSIEFLKDDSEMEVILANDKDWLFKSAEEKADILIPYVETRYMINESVALKAKMTSTGLGVQEERSATKDRYMCIGYINLFLDKVETKINKENQQDLFDFDDMQLVW